MPLLRKGEVSIETKESEPLRQMSDKPGSDGIAAAGPVQEDAMKLVSGSYGTVGGELLTQTLAKASAVAAVAAEGRAVVSKAETSVRRESIARSESGKLNFRVFKRRVAATDDKSKRSKEELPSVAALPPTPPLSSTTILSSSTLGSIRAQAQPVQQSSGISTPLPDSSSSTDKATVRRKSSRLQARRTTGGEEGIVAIESASSNTKQSKTSNRSVKASKENESTSKRLPRAARSNGTNAPDLSMQGESPQAADFWHNSLSNTPGSPDKLIEAIASETDASANAAVLPIVAGRTCLSTPQDIAVALDHLKSVDQLLGAVIARHEEPQFQRCNSAFSALARSIVFQQLATKAAAAIFGRLLDACQGMDNLTPANISVLTPAQLRAIGLSERKASYLHHLAANFTSGALSDSAIREMDDDALMKALTAVKGIGVWSVHMFMIFSLHKPDVLPVGDLGVRKGFQQLYQLKTLPTPAEVEKIASCWKPYRSLGSWYMWRVINNVPPLKPGST